MCFRWCGCYLLLSLFYIFLCSICGVLEDDMFSSDMLWMMKGIIVMFSVGLVVSLVLIMLLYGVVCVSRLVSIGLLVLFRLLLKCVDFIGWVVVSVLCGSILCVFRLCR